MRMAGNEEARNSRRWRDDAQPIVESVDEYYNTGHATAGGTSSGTGAGTRGRPAGAAGTGGMAESADGTYAAVPYNSLEDERPVPKWPYIVGAALLLVIPIIVIIILVTVV
jgi:hypothetical protein